MDLNEVVSKINEVCEDQSLHKRVKEALSKVSENLGKTEKDTAIKITSAIYALDELANDVNIPVHEKTVLWDVISHLESIRSS